jgi:rare lipoprotein A
MQRFMTIILATAFAIPSLTAQNRKPESSTTSSPNHPSTVVQQKAARKHWYQVGKASWYGPHFQGKETASGESFDMNELTAAHRDLPLGSVVRVTNMANGKQVTVRINDRGPVYRSRIIDLSFKAAKLLGFRSEGIQMVRLEVIATPVQVADRGSIPSMP